MRRRAVAIALATGVAIAGWGGSPAHAGPTYTIVAPSPLIFPAEMGFIFSGCNSAFANQQHNVGGAVIDVGAWASKTLNIKVDGVAPTAGVFGALSVTYMTSRCTPGSQGPDLHRPGTWSLNIPAGVKWAVVKNSAWATATLTMP